MTDIQLFKSVFDVIEKMRKPLARLFRKSWLWLDFHWEHHRLTDWQVILLSKALQDCRDTVCLVGQSERPDDVSDAIQRFMQADLAVMTHSDLVFEDQYMRWVNKRRTKVIDRAKQLKEQTVTLNVERYIRRLSGNEWMAH